MKDPPNLKVGTLRVQEKNAVEIFDGRIFFHPFPAGNWTPVFGLEVPTRYLRFLEGQVELDGSLWFFFIIVQETQRLHWILPNFDWDFSAISHFTLVLKFEMNICYDFSAARNICKNQCNLWVPKPFMANIDQPLNLNILSNLSF